MAYCVGRLNPKPESRVPGIAPVRKIDAIIGAEREEGRAPARLCLLGRLWFQASDIEAFGFRVADLGFGIQSFGFRVAD